MLGSFATALSWRVPRGVSWIGGGKAKLARSACPKCDKPIKNQHLVPVFSWLYLKGKCHDCSERIAAKYPLMELFTLLGCLGVYAVWGFTVPAFIIMAAVPLLVALFVIDMEHMLLPNQLVLLLAALAVFLVIYQVVGYGFGYGFVGQALSKFAAAILYAGLIWLAARALGHFMKKDTLGMGDVKFFAMAGLWLGLPDLPFFLIFSGLTGVFVGGYYRFFLKKQVFPFGPALILSLYAGLLLQGLEIVPLIGVQ